MRKKQCKYVNGFVYPFLSFPPTPILGSPPPFANETSMPPHMWSRGVFLGHLLGPVAQTMPPRKPGMYL